MVGGEAPNESGDPTMGESSVRSHVVWAVLPLLLMFPPGPAACLAPEAAGSDDQGGAATLQVDSAPPTLDK